MVYLKGEYMGKIVHEYETEYEVGDLVIFKKNGLEIGVIEGYYVDDGYFWFNIRVSPSTVYTYTNQGDISEGDILGKLNGELGNECRKYIVGK